jgi:hypothetical protein
MALCVKCGHDWEPRVPKPLECPSCRQRKWDEPRVYTDRKIVSNEQPTLTIQEVKQEPKEQTIKRRIVKLD